MVVSMLTDSSPELQDPASLSGLQDGLNARIDAQLALLDPDDPALGDAVARRLLSMGPGVIPLLLDRLKLLEGDPAALSADAQHLIEEVLKGFGLQTWIAMASLIRDVHRASPMYPALIRVLAGLGPQTLADIASATHPPDPAAVLVPVLSRLAPQLASTLLHLQDGPHDASHDDFFLACLPVFAADPSLFERALAQASPPTRRRLLSVAAAWPLPQQRAIVTAALDEDDAATVAWALQERAVQILASADGFPGAQPSLLSLFRRGRLVGFDADEVAWRILLTIDPRDAFLDASDESAHSLLQDLKSFLEHFDEVPRDGVEAALAELDGEGTERALAAVWALGAMLDDPRAVERLVDLARTSRGALGALALVTLARVGLGPLEALIAARVRMAGSVAGASRLWLRLAVAATGEPLTEGLLRLLRVESSGTASTAALLLAPLTPSPIGVLKAIGRHRYAPIESHVAPLIWARWPLCGDQVEAALSHPDREIAQAALIMIGTLGDPHQGDALIDLLEKRPELAELTLNTLEMLGPAVVNALERLAERDPVLARTYHLPRRVALLKAMS